MSGDDIGGWSPEDGAGYIPTEEGGSGREANDSEHKTVGEIDGHEVVVTVTGPEAQVLDDDSRMGSDVLMSRINRKLTELKDGDGDSA